MKACKGHAYFNSADSYESIPTQISSIINCPCLKFCNNILKYKKNNVTKNINSLSCNEEPMKNKTVTAFHHLFMKSHYNQWYMKCENRMSYKNIEIRIFRKRRKYVFFAEALKYQNGKISSTS